MVASEFFDYNEAKGWEGVRDWKAAARRWASKESTFGQKPKPRSKDPTVGTFTWDDGSREPPPDKEAEQRKALEARIRAYRDGKRNKSLVELLRTARRNGTLEKYGLSWSDE